jgi:hypothetical protein
MCEKAKIQARWYVGAAADTGLGGEASVRGTKIYCPVRVHLMSEECKPDRTDAEAVLMEY